MQAHKILIVDDDEKLLKSFKRVLGKRFTTVAVPDGAAALEAVRGDTEFSVVISDYKMPGMNGLEFLGIAREEAPDMVRILLTGYADLEMALTAVNETDVFRLLTKPCSPQVLARALTDAIRYREALTAQHEMMERTLTASVRLLADVISLVKPDVFSRMSRILPTVRGLTRRVAKGPDWEIETAAHLSMLGFVTLPDKIVAKVLSGKALDPLEQGVFEDHPEFASEFIAKVPRMEGVARIVAYQLKNYDGSGVPADGVMGGAIPLGARILRVAIDFDVALQSGLSKGDALTRLLKAEGTYDPGVLDALTDLVGDEARYSLKSYHLLGLRPGMVLAEDVYGRRRGKKTKVLARGQVLTDMVIEYMLRYSRRYEIDEPIDIIEPLSCAL